MKINLSPKKRAYLRKIKNMNLTELFQNKKIVDDYISQYVKANKKKEKPKLTYQEYLEVMLFSHYIEKALDIKIKESKKQFEFLKKGE